MEGNVPDSNAGVTYPLQPLVTRWCNVLDAARKSKKEEFDQWADEAMTFFDGPVNAMWDSVIKKAQTSDGHDGFLSDEANLPDFRMSVNRLFEAVSMFGPALYHQNPTIAVTPRRLPNVSMDTYFAGDEQAMELLSMIPAMEQGIIGNDATMEAALDLEEEYLSVNQQAERRKIVDADHAAILEALVNYIQQEGSKKDEARRAITEAIITGLGILEIKVGQSPGGGPKMAYSCFRTNKDLLVDPDAKYWRDVTWIALRSVEPVNRVEEKFGLEPGSLKGKYARPSSFSPGNQNASRHGRDNQVANRTHDLVEYWEIYSKNGAGQHIKTSDKDPQITGLESLGDFVKLAICKQCKYPLNLPPQVLMEGPEAMVEATSWEVPYWDDVWSDGGWPIARLSFYEKPGQVWPMSMVKPCIGEMRFINWCMSFIADKVSAGSKIYVATLKEAGENIRQQLTGSSGPFTHIELEKIMGKKSINDVISFLTAPTFSIDIWKMVAEVNQQIDKRLGLTELMYGLTGGSQMRSAAEATYRQNNVNIRPDDMASRVEDWLSLSATREIQATRFLCEFEDVEPIIGQVAAHVFATQILTDDVSRITRDFTFRVAAGTARKPNKDTKISQLSDISQYMLPLLQQLATAGVIRPYNAFIEDLTNAMDMDGSKYLMNEQDAQTLMLMNAPPAPAGSEEDDGKA